MTPKLSLVFPCYHAAQHMPHVLEDLQAQTFADFEAILVNDGDESQVEAMEQIAAQDSRIRIVHRSENGGPSAARNSGTDAVNSPWVTYPDPDDRFGPDYARSLFEAVNGPEGVEMACGGYTTVFVDRDQQVSPPEFLSENVEVLEMADAYGRLFNCEVKMLNYVWNGIYDVGVMRSNALRFDSGFLDCEDVLFTLMYLQHVKHIGVFRDCGYVYYRKDYGGMTNCYNPRHLQNIREIADIRKAFHRRIGWQEPRTQKVWADEMAYGVHTLFRNYFVDGCLTIREAVPKVQTELLAMPEYTDAFLQKDFGKDRLLWIEQALVRTGNAWLIVLCYKSMAFFKRHFGKLYSQLKPFIRGE